MVRAIGLGGNTMGAYQRILLAVDLTEESNEVAERATALAQAFSAELHVVHVIEPLSLAYGGDIPMDLSSVQDQIHEQAGPEAEQPGDQIEGEHPSLGQFHPGSEPQGERHRECAQ